MKPVRWLAPVVAGVVFILAVPPAPTEAGILVDHSTNRTYCSFSDTLLGPSGTLQWQQTADDIMLDTAATIRHVTWWGLYLDDVVPSVETMRIRFYDARPGDGLPGDVRFEQNLLNPSRAATGVIIPAILPGSTLTAAEYRFEADLPAPISLNTDTPYWLEIVQVGDIDTVFGWRGASIEETGRAVKNPIYYRDWLLDDGFDMAFQLSTIPEPCTLALIVLGARLAGRKTRLRVR